MSNEDDSIKGQPEIDALSLEERRLIYLLSGDLGLSDRPYAELGLKLGRTEDEILALVVKLKEKGLIRRFGAILVHQKSGYSANAMVVWQMEEKRVVEAGKKLAELPHVSHCYERRPAPGWPYNLYTMVHARSSAELEEKIKEMISLSEATSWSILESLREFKKDSVRYFKNDGTGLA